MDIYKLKQLINKNDKLKHFIHKLIIKPRQARPRLWIKLFINPFFFKKGKGSIISRNTMLNISPINSFRLGCYSIIENYSVVDNGVGAVYIGNNTRIGLRNTVIGPVKIGNFVVLAQNIVLSGLNHNYMDIDKPISKQGVNTKGIIIDDETWIGANCVITAGVHIGKHVIIAAGSVVTKSIPDYSVAVGNPAKVIKRYDFDKKEWIKI